MQRQRIAWPAHRRLAALAEEFRRGALAGPALGTPGCIERLQLQPLLGPLLVRLLHARQRRPLGHALWQEVYARSQHMRAPRLRPLRLPVPLDGRRRFGTGGQDEAPAGEREDVTGGRLGEELGLLQGHLCGGGRSG